MEGIKLVEKTKEMFYFLINAILNLVDWIEETILALCYTRFIRK